MFEHIKTAIKRFMSPASTLLPGSLIATMYSVRMFGDVRTNYIIGFVCKGPCIMITAATDDSFHRRHETNKTRYFIIDASGAYGWVDDHDIHLFDQID